jgi:hypothetical protein
MTFRVISSLEFAHIVYCMKSASFKDSASSTRIKLTFYCILSWALFLLNFFNKE